MKKGGNWTGLGAKPKLGREKSRKHHEKSTDGKDEGCRRERRKRNAAQQNKIWIVHNVKGGGRDEETHDHETSPTLSCEAGGRSPT